MHPDVIGIGQGDLQKSHAGKLQCLLTFGITDYIGVPVFHRAYLEHIALEIAQIPQKRVEYPRHRGTYDIVSKTAIACVTVNSRAKALAVAIKAGAYHRPSQYSLLMLALSLPIPSKSISSSIISVSLAFSFLNAPAL